MAQSPPVNRLPVTPVAPPPVVHRPASVKTTTAPASGAVLPAAAAAAPPRPSVPRAAPLPPHTAPPAPSSADPVDINRMLQNTIYYQRLSFSQHLGPRLVGLLECGLAAGPGAPGQPGSFRVVDASSAPADLLNALLQGVVPDLVDRSIVPDQRAAEVHAALTRVTDRAEQALASVDARMTLDSERLRQLEEESRARRRQTIDRERTETFVKEVTVALQSKLTERFLKQGLTLEPEAAHVLAQAIQHRLHQSLNQIVRISRHRTEVLKDQLPIRKLYEPKAILKHLDERDWARLQGLRASWSAATLTAPGPEDAMDEGAGTFLPMSKLSTC